MTDIQGIAKNSLTSGLLVRKLELDPKSASGFKVVYVELSEVFDTKEAGIIADQAAEITRLRAQVKTAGVEGYRRAQREAEQATLFRGTASKDYMEGRLDAYNAVRNLSPQAIRAMEDVK